MYINADKDGKGVDFGEADIEMKKGKRKSKNEASLF